MNDKTNKEIVNHDSVNHPRHYIAHPSGVECIQITEHMGFNLGNAIKYIWRADLKHDAIVGLFAYDSGATDSGIHDESLRSEIRKIFEAMTDDETRRWITPRCREEFMSDAAINKGYGIEYAYSFWQWFDENGLFL